MTGSPEWTIVGRLGRWSGGSTPAKEAASFWHNGTVPWVTPKDMGAAALVSSEDLVTEAGAAQLTQYRAGDVAVVFRSSILRHRMPVARGFGRFTVNQDIKVLRPAPDIDSAYAFYAVCGVERVALIRAVKAGTTVESLDGDVFFKLPVFCPPRPEQRTIAAVLDALDNTIRRTEQIIAKLQQVKQGLLHDLLTRGIDDNGELRDPERHPEQFRDSPLGRIPRKWAVRELGDLASVVTSGSRGWGVYYAEDGALFLRIGNLTREHINLRFDDVVFVRPPTTGEGLRTKLQGGDLLISITADLGIVGVVPLDFGEAYVNQHIALVRIDPVRANSRYVGHFMASRNGEQQVRRLDDSGAKAGLNLPTVRRMRVALPLREEQDRISDRLDTMDTAVRREQGFHRQLLMLKSGVAEDLLTGRVRTTSLTGTTP